jgi:hypothetical protein
MTTQQMSLVLEDTAINLPERSEDFECNEEDLAAFNAELASQTVGAVRAVSVESVRVSAESDDSQDKMWIATLSVKLTVEADPSFFSKIRSFDEVPELHHLKETVLDSIAGISGLDFSGSWYMREMGPAPEQAIEATGFTM